MTIIYDNENALAVFLFRIRIMLLLNVLKYYIIPFTRWDKFEHDGDCEMFFHNDSDDDGLFPEGFEHMLPVHINRNVER